MNYDELYNNKKFQLLNAERKLQSYNILLIILAVIKLLFTIMNIKFDLHIFNIIRLILTFGLFVVPIKNLTKPKLNFTYFDSEDDTEQMDFIINKNQALIDNKYKSFYISVFVVCGYYILFNLLYLRAAISCLKDMYF